MGPHGTYLHELHPPGRGVEQLWQLPPLVLPAKREKIFSVLFDAHAEQTAGEKSPIFLSSPVTVPHSLHLNSYTGMCVLQGFDIITIPHESILSKYKVYPIQNHFKNYLVIALNADAGM